MHAAIGSWTRRRVRSNTRPLGITAARSRSFYTAFPRAAPTRCDREARFSPRSSLFSEEEFETDCSNETFFVDAYARLTAKADECERTAGPESARLIRDASNRFARRARVAHVEELLKAARKG